MKHFFEIFIFHRPYKSYEDSVTKALCSFIVPSCFLWLTRNVNYARKNSDKTLMRHFLYKKSCSISTKEIQSGVYCHWKTIFRKNNSEWRKKRQFTRTKSGIIRTRLIWHDNRFTRLIWRDNRFTRLMGLYTKQY